jgi:hypothetical protein
MAKITKPGGKAGKPAAAKAAPKSKYAKVSGADVFREGNYISPGRYIALIERVEEGSTHEGKDFIAINLLPLLADGDGRGELDEKGGALKRVGESCTDMSMVANVAFAPNMLAFAMTASGMSQEEIQAAEEHEGQFVEEIVGEDQPLAGVVVEINAKCRPKKDFRNKPINELGDKEFFTKVSYLRRVPFAELPDLIDANVLARHLPDLDEKIAQEAAETE